MLALHCVTVSGAAIRCRTSDQRPCGLPPADVRVRSRRSSSGDPRRTIRQNRPVAFPFIGKKQTPQRMQGVVRRPARPRKLPKRLLRLPRETAHRCMHLGKERSPIRAEKLFNLLRALRQLCRIPANFFRRQQQRQRIRQVQRDSPVAFTDLLQPDPDNFPRSHQRIQIAGAKIRQPRRQNLPFQLRSQQSRALQ